MSTFENALLAHCRTVVAARAAQPAPGRRAGLRLVAAAAATVAVASVAALGLAGGTSPAYAVDRAPDGTVKLTIYQVTALDPVVADLRAAGVPAVAVPLTDGCPVPAGVVVGRRIISVGPLGPAGQPVAVYTFAAGGDLVVLAAAQHDGRWEFADATAAGVTPSCLPAIPAGERPTD